MKDLFCAQDVRLAPFREGDELVMARWHEDSAFLRHVDTDIAFPPTLATLREYSTHSPTTYPFIIRLLQPNEAIGFVSLHSVEWNNRTALLSIGIGPGPHRGKGHGRQALALILQYAFCELNLHRVGLGVIDFNHTAHALYQAAGFVEEGRARQFVCRDGKHYDMIYMGILKEEWLAKQPT